MFTSTRKYYYRNSHLENEKNYFNPKEVNELTCSHVTFWWKGQKPTSGLPRPLRAPSPNQHCSSIPFGWTFTEQNQTLESRKAVQLVGGSPGPEGNPVSRFLAQ